MSNIVVNCRGCGAAWLAGIGCACRCFGPSLPGYEDWVTGADATRLPRLHGAPGSPAGWDVLLRCGHEIHVWGQPTPGTWISCFVPHGCQTQRQVVTSSRADLVICGSWFTGPLRPRVA